jgi:hypothetical protein
MTLRCKKPRPLTREERPLRDARLFIIATEDTYAPERYFGLFKNPRIKVNVLPTEEGRSAPEHVLDRLDAFRKQYELLAEDEFWLMLDTDHWIEPSHVSNFDRVCGEAVQKGYQLANSNPCFEVWILLHVFPLDAGTQFVRCGEVVARLRELLGEYSKRTLDARHFTPDSMREAVMRAEMLARNPTDRWPQTTGSHVYKVVRKLL